MSDLDPAAVAFLNDLDANGQFRTEPFGAGKEPGEQGSVEWLMERVGFCTASKFSAVMDFKARGGEGAKRAAYRTELVGERLTGKPTQRYITDAMQDGTDREPMSRMAYEAHTGLMVAQTGFIHHPSIQWVGGSPDGIVADDGGVELKNPKLETLINLLLTGDVSAYFAQCQGLMWITGRKWWDVYVSHPDLAAPFLQRITRDDLYIAELERQVVIFLAEVADTVAKLQAYASAEAKP